MHPMELLDDVCHMESFFGLFRNSVSFGARYVHGLRLMHRSLRNHFGSTETNNISKWIKARLYMTHVIKEFHRVHAN